MKDNKVTEKTLLKAVHNYFVTDYKYCLKNSFVFQYNWESDYFCVSKEGYSIEIEVKKSKSDFKADFKKEKHKLFEEKSTKKLIPNRFYFAVPKGLITEDDLPSYAGLIYVDGYHATIKKRAPFLHKKKTDFRKILCDKFYFNQLQQKRKYSRLEYDHEQLQKKLENLWLRNFAAENEHWQILTIDFEKKKVVGKFIPRWDMKTNEYIKRDEIKEFDIKDVKFS